MVIVLSSVKSAEVSDTAAWQGHPVEPAVVSPRLWERNFIILAKSYRVRNKDRFRS